MLIDLPVRDEAGADTRTQGQGDHPGPVLAAAAETFAEGEGGSVVDEAKFDLVVAELLVQFLRQIHPVQVLELLLHPRDAFFIIEGTGESEADLRDLLPEGLHRTEEILLETGKDPLGGAAAVHRSQDRGAAKGLLIEINHGGAEVGSTHVDADCVFFRIHLVLVLFFDLSKIRYFIG